MPADWLSNSSDAWRRMSAALEGALRFLAEPARARRLRQILVAVFALWAVLALARFIWALFPAADTALPGAAQIINPVSIPAPGEPAQVVDIGLVQSWHLFGEPGSEAEEVVQEAPVQVREGIEKGARETRLDLKLRGVVASSEDGMGYAIIEHKSRQDIYAVEDKLPVSGQVSLAKVMPGQVVLDNRGTYELLQLFEESPLDTQLDAQDNTPVAREPVVVDKGDDADATELARSYRERLYDNPQSLAEVVTVSAVRENGKLLGYRIAPGKERAQFEQLGFKQGDLVTSVNGIALDDPANTLRLYQAMRTAGEAVFDLQRNNQAMTVSVSLDDAPPAQ